MSDKDYTVEQAFQALKERRNAESSKEEPQKQLPTSEDDNEVVEQEETARPEEDVVEDFEEDEVENEDDTESDEELEDDIEESDESEEDENENLDEDDNDEDKDLYQIGDIQATLDEVKSWKEGHMRLSDYTKKTKEISQIRKRSEESEKQFNEAIKAVNEDADKLKVLISEYEEDIDWEDLREYEHEKYIVEKEKQEKRKQALSNIEKYKQVEEQKYINDEKNKLYNSNPEWFDEKGSVTDNFHKDMGLIDNFLSKKGFTSEDVNKITNHKVWNLILESAKNSGASTEHKKKKDVLKKKLKKAPIVTKGGSKVGTSTGLKAKIEKAEAKYKASGSEADYLSLRKLKRQLKK